MVTYNVTYNVISLVFLANTAGCEHRVLLDAFLFFPRLISFFVSADFAASISNSFLLHHYGLKNSLLVSTLLPVRKREKPSQFR